MCSHCGISAEAPAQVRGIAFEPRGDTFAMLGEDILHNPEVDDGADVTIKDNWKSPKIHFQSYFQVQALWVEAEV